MGQPSNRTIVGVGILLFTGVLMGVGIHHLISTGTCSSTGYSGTMGRAVLPVGHRLVDGFPVHRDHRRHRRRRHGRWLHRRC